jgi:hypothetical protein
MAGKVLKDELAGSDSDLMYYPEIILDGLRKTTKNLSQDRWCFSRDSSQTSPEYKPAELPLDQPAQSWILHVLTVVFWHEAKWVGELPARHNVSSQVITIQIMSNIDTNSSEYLLFFPYCGAGLCRAGIFLFALLTPQCPCQLSWGYLADTGKLSSVYMWKSWYTSHDSLR